MRLIKISGIILIALIIATACKAKKGSSDSETTDGKDGTSETHDVNDIVMGETFLLPKSIDNVTINSVDIKGDILEINVSYGGCGLHDFVLYGNRSYQKSLPPKLGLALIHDAHGDNCKKQSTETLYFNIKPIRYPNKDEDYVIVVYVNQESGKSVDYKY